jgi:hypothetical protein
MAERTLTDTQKSVLEKLRKKHYVFIAEATEQNWLRGESYYIDLRVGIPARLRAAFNKANDQVLKQSTGE